MLYYKLTLHFSEIDCKEPCQPEQSTSLISLEGTLYMDTATYECDVGSSLISGNLTRTCLADGMWSGDVPVCGQ